MITEKNCDWRKLNRLVNKFVGRPWQEAFDYLEAKKLTSKLYNNQPPYKFKVEDGILRRYSKRKPENFQPFVIKHPTEKNLWFAKVSVKSGPVLWYVVAEYGTIIGNGYYCRYKDSRGNIYYENTWGLYDHVRYTDKEFSFDFKRPKIYIPDTPDFVCVIKSCGRKDMKYIKEYLNDCSK
jgi:hypothetical protein